ncbi:MAG: 2-oxoacid:acceptor oxidoreductase subunit alpha [bacterium]|nr:2-oxoacid:acceptor oxidoreductase subunit alpha [bacterium]
MNRTTVKVVGESGMGLASVGLIIAKSLKRMGYSIHSDREYPSLIKGGHSSVQIDFSTLPIHCLSEQADIVVALDRAGLEEYLGSVKKGGIIIHGYERHQLIKDLEKQAKSRHITLLYLPGREIASSVGGSVLMTNMVLLGLLWKVLNIKLKGLEDEVREKFKSKPQILEINLKCLSAGYAAESIKKVPQYSLPHPKRARKKILIDGNAALALGAIHCGVRAYYAYPMSPSSSILTHMANWSHQTGMLVKQGEDEITVVQLAMGSMFMGTRALCATSGGGYDLMTESVSLAGMIECPLVVILAQRPGPATGLPTWTAQADLNLAIYSSHGEFPRAVLAVSDPTSAFELIQHAFNIAERFQTPVLVLTEKVIAESLALVDPFDQKKIPIERGLVTDKAELKKLKSSDRYAITKTGVSKRWLPGSSPAFYFANGDEHWEDGTLTEEAKDCEAMIAKRLRKLVLIEKSFPEPKVYGSKTGADISFIGWGSSKGVMLDVIEEARQKGITVNYLHYEYLWPLKTKAVIEFCRKNKNIHLIEGNHDGQLSNLIEGKTDLKFKKRFLKWDGRPFFVEEVLEYVRKHTQ